ncbi:uncharacterized protein LOC119076326 [Bradysia coprophila]|uniref:uncharacterized protein LOC119076326 n=1 Tax=Bradysia coprophila TaxID=38358 RepID=UPI00187DA6CF|nr:uncharacterized protein LOC119076326 [Bradysia coprophila]
MLHIKETLQNINPSYKGVGNLLLDSHDDDAQWNILQENVSLPAATLSSSAINHNQLWMETFAERFKFLLAPHGKTTMLPGLFSLQVASQFCYGMTLATVSQVTVAFKSGIKRVIMANQLVGKCNMDIISTIMENDPTFEFICLVDSSENVAQIGQFFGKRKQNVKVLLEYGVDGGRTGIRDENRERTVLTELRNWTDSVSVVGVEFFEGILQDATEIRRFISWSLSRVQKLAADNVFINDEIIITGAGTSWFDIVAEDFLKFQENCPLRLKKIIRSGCYLIYDNGLYAQMEKRVSDMNFGEGNEWKILSESLKPTLKVWAYVQSIPEKNLAIIGMGRRDAGNDSGFPVLHLHFRPGQAAPTYYDKTKYPEVFKMMDQHTFLRIGDDDDFQVGDIVAFDIYHACTTMDKWRNVLLIDDEFNVRQIFQSEF